MFPRPTRRQFLASATAAGSVAVAGCLDFGDGREPSPVESPYDLAVEHDVESWAHYDPDWTPPETFAPRIVGPSLSGAPRSAS